MVLTRLLLSKTTSNHSTLTSFYGVQLGSVQSASAALSGSGSRDSQLDAAARIEYLTAPFSLLYLFHNIARLLRRALKKLCIDSSFPFFLPTFYEFEFKFSACIYSSTFYRLVDQVEWFMLRWYN